MKITIGWVVTVVLVFIATLYVTAQQKPDYEFEASNGVRFTIDE